MRISFWKALFRVISALSSGHLFTSSLSKVHHQCIVLADGLRDSVRHVEAVVSESGPRQSAVVRIAILDLGNADSQLQAPWASSRTLELIDGQ
jgi:hypothetical protein